MNGRLLPRPAGGRFKALTKYIDRLADCETTDDYAVKFRDCFPFDEFKAEWLQSDFPRTDYGDVLTAIGAALDCRQITTMNVDSLNAEQILALITATFRNDCFDNGALVEYFRSGAMLRWLKRLRDIDGL